MDLKADLAKIDQHFDQLPESEREKGLHAIATHPPLDGSFLTTDLWDRFLPKWRQNLVKKKVSMSKESNDRLIRELNDFTEGQQIRPEDVDFDSESADALVLKREIHKKKGKWWQIAKDIKA